jgi:hypothetical protein
MVYYKGGVTYSELQAMPLPEMFELLDNAKTINESIEREQKRNTRK